MNTIRKMIFFVTSIFVFNSAQAMQSAVRRVTPVLTRATRSAQPARVARTLQPIDEVQNSTQKNQIRTLRIPQKKLDVLYQRYVRPAICAAAVTEQMVTSIDEAETMLLAVELKLAEIRNKIRLKKQAK